MSVNRNLLRGYERLRWHRCLLVEAMRVIAFRNRDHLYVTSVRLGVPNRNDSESLKRIFDQMLLDQGREQTEAERHVLGWASRASWEVYMCMLYTLIEDYRRIRQNHPNAAYPPMDDFLQSHRELAQNLKAVRHKLLHPLRTVDYLDSLSDLNFAARHVAPDVFLACEHLQNKLDDCLEHLRDVLQKALEDEVVDLPPDELAIYFHRQQEDLRSRAEQAGNTALIEEMERSDVMASFNCMIQPQLNRDLAVDDVPLGRVERLEETFKLLTSAVPERPYRKNVDSVQTPVVQILAHWVLRASYGGQVESLREHLRPDVMRHRSGFLELLVRSITIYNETHAALISRYDSTYPDVPIETIPDEESWMEAMRQSTPTDTDAELRKAMLEVAPSSIALALLAEPLRIYRELIQKNPELSRGEIDRDTLDEAERVFRELRRTIFHVPHGELDLFEANEQLAHAAVSHGDYLHIVAGLTYFFQGIDPAVHLDGH